MELLAKYFPDLTASQWEKFEALQPLYESWNSRINVISRQDIHHLAERHILHSLAIARFSSFVPGTRIIDIGTGGGFPGIPLAIFFPEVEFLLVDSIGKKITVAAAVAEELKLVNVETRKARAEELKERADFTVSRAVSTLSDLVKWSRPLIKRTSHNPVANGLICLKGGDLDKEIRDARTKARLINLLDYFSGEYFETKKLVYVPL
jgi:16S rRNA (guanine527-N7)-methyltransferase